jgi:hypothetical protein
MDDDEEVDMNKVENTGLDKSEKKKKRKKNKKTEKSPEEQSSEVLSPVEMMRKNEQLLLSKPANATSEGSNKRKNKKKRKLEASPETENASINSTKKKKSSSPPLPQTIQSEVSVDIRDEYPYEVIPDDHCETPLEAYQDISPLLQLIAQSIQKTSSSLSIYDPFFCEGSMVERMGSLGFTNVYNRKEDFYAMKSSNQLPPFDLLLTNPPYSLDHMDRLLSFCINEMKGKQPFCLLLPNYVYMKDYFSKYNHFFNNSSSSSSGSSSGGGCFIVPKNRKRYLYTTPKVRKILILLCCCVSLFLFLTIVLCFRKQGRRQQKSGKITSPFPTFWYCGRFSPSMINEFRRLSNNSVTVVYKTTEIPTEV